jgi:hypothetical protein
MKQRETGRNNGINKEQQTIKKLNQDEKCEGDKKEQRIRENKERRVTRRKLET